MTKTTRKAPAARKEQILAVALVLAEADGYQRITRDGIAAAAGLSGPTVQYHFGTMAQLRRDLMRYAIRQNSLRVIGQGVACGDAQAGKLNEELRAAALAELARAPQTVVHVQPGAADHIGVV